MSEVKILFREEDINGDSIYLVEINNNLKIFLNSKSISLTDNKSKELLHSLLIFRRKK